MKRKELIKHLIDNGCELEREGSKHTIFYNPITNKSATVPRHRDINTFTARAICKDLGIQIIKIKKKITNNNSWQKSNTPKTNSKSRKTT